MSKTAVFSITRSRAQVERIIDRLRLAGVAYSEISVLLPDTQSRPDIGHVKAAKAPEGTAAVAGGLVGLLAGLGSLAIAGAGAFIAAGPIMAALNGAAVGATAGGVVGGLIGLGIPEVEAGIYKDKLDTGNYLISVHAKDRDQVRRAKDIYESEGAEHISTSSQTPVPEPSYTISHK